MSKIKTINGIPVYSAEIGSAADGMLCISLVDDPAVESLFQAFDAKRQPVLCSVTDDEKRLILGVVMRADFPIYRRDDQNGEYYIVYSAETIREMAQKYLAEDRANLLNLMHDGDPDIEGVELVQWFIKDAAAGVAPEGFDDIKDGSLFAEFHVENDEVWQAVKAGTYRGFSLEGLFTLVPVEMQREQPEKQPAPAVEYPTIFNKLSKNMGKRIKAIFAAIASALVLMGKIATDKGILSYDGDEDLKAGDAVKLDQEDGSQIDAPDDVYTTEDGKKITVKDGKVESIEDPEAEVAPEELKKETAATVKAETEGDGEAAADKGLEERVTMLEKAVKSIADYFGMIVLEFKNQKGEATKLAAEVEKLRKEPAAAPATKETPEVEAKLAKTGDKGKDHLAALMAAKKQPLSK